MNGQTGGSLAEFAARHGLTQSAARPTLAKYIRDVWDRRAFIWSFASAKSMSAYTDSRLGQVWQILTPLLNAFVYYLIFGVLLGKKGDVANYIPFLVTGVFVFSFCQRSLTAGAKSVGSNLSLIRALHFPRASLPFAYVIVELQHLVIAMGVLVVIVLAKGEPITWHWILVIPALALQLLFNIGASLVVARMGAFVRDIQQLLPFILRTWFYFSGIFFMAGKMAQQFAERGAPWVGRVLEANPGYVYTELVREALLKSYRHDLVAVRYTKSGQAFTYAEYVHHPWLWAIGWAAVAFIGGFWYFYRAEERYGRG